MAGHVTNHGFQGRASEQVYPDEITWQGDLDAMEVDQSTRTLSAFRRYLRAQGYDDVAWWEEVKAVVFKTYAAVLPALRKGWKTLATDPKYRYMLPRIAGLDVHLDDARTPWLLEVNPNPALVRTCQSLSRATVALSICFFA